MESNKVKQFRTNKGISDRLLYQLLEKSRKYGLNEVIPFSVSEIIVAEWVHLKCRYGCNKYNTNWCCPPATPNPDKVRKILNEYTQALLLVGRKKCPDFYRNNKRKRAMQVKCWKGTVSLERMLFLTGYYKAFSLVGECCALCLTCAYPEDCRFSQEKRPSVESFSIDVIGTLNNVGIEASVAGNADDTFSYYAIILLE
jgi:predicted metal-binding protein